MVNFLGGPEEGRTPEFVMSKHDSSPDRAHFVYHNKPVFKNSLRNWCIMYLC